MGVQKDSSVRPEARSKEFTDESDERAALIVREKLRLVREAAQKAREMDDGEAGA